jgi:hypothetical protein
MLHSLMTWGWRFLEYFCEHIVCQVNSNANIYKLGPIQKMRFCLIHLFIFHQKIRIKCMCHFNNRRFLTDTSGIHRINSHWTMSHDRRRWTICGLPITLQMINDETSCWQDALAWRSQTTKTEIRPIIVHPRLGCNTKSRVWDFAALVHSSAHVTQMS